MTAGSQIEDFFVCVGAQKAGTTWLARVLGRHPDLFITPVKEIHYFDHVQGVTQHLSDRKRRSRRRKYYQRMITQWHRFSEYRGQAAWYRDYMRDPMDDAWYASLFKHRGKARFAGEATPEYALIGRSGFEHMRRLAPGARILFIMRNPVARAWSQLLHLSRKQGIDVATQTDAALVELIDTGRFEPMTDYIKVLDDLEAVFPPDQLHLEFYEDMHLDREGALRRVCAFIGLDFADGRFEGLETRVNASQRGPMPSSVRAHLRDRYEGLAEDIERRIGRVPESWQSEFAR